MTADPSKLSIEEVRELLIDLRSGDDGPLPIDANRVPLVDALCRHFLASQQPMTAGEFAAELIAVCECQCLDWEALANNAPAHEAVLRATRNARLSEWSAMKLTIESLARDRNIIIVEPKK